MFKKIGILCVLLLFLILTSCGGGYLSLVKDDVPQEYINSEYHHAWLSCYEYSQGYLESMIEQLKRAVKEDDDSSDAEKNIQLNNIRVFEKYEQNRYYGVTLMTSMPLLKKNLNLKFSIATANNSQLAENVVSLHQKLTFTNQYGSSYHYYYYWIIRSNIPINNKYISDADKPINLIATYPNGKTQTFLILKKEK